VLYDTCSDVCDGFDLWQGNRQLRARQPYHQKASLTDLIEVHQRVAIQKEEDISQSRWMIARSRRLIEALDRANSAASYRNSNWCHTKPRLCISAIHLRCLSGCGRDAGGCRYFGLTDGSPPGVPGGGMTGMGSADRGGTSLISRSTRAGGMITPPERAKWELVVPLSGGATSGLG